MGKAQREIPHCSRHYKPRPPHPPECPCFSWPAGLGRDPSVLQTPELEMRGEGKIPSAPFTEMSSFLFGFRFPKRSNWDSNTSNTYISRKKTKLKTKTKQQRPLLTFYVADLDVLGIRQGRDVDLGTRCLLQETHISPLLANEPTN